MKKMMRLCTTFTMEVGTFIWICMAFAPTVSALMKRLPQYDRQRVEPGEQRDQERGKPKAAGDPFPARGSATPYTSTMPAMPAAAPASEGIRIS